MYTKNEILSALRAMEIRKGDTLMVHSSVKSVGKLEHRADDIIDALMEAVGEEGLLLTPCHTWAQMGANHNVFDPETEPSCVGALPDVFRKRPGVVRSLHPTHSVNAWGRDAAEYAAGEEKAVTPCPRNGCWGKLYDRRAKILLLGCGLNRNTFIHSVEEWADVPLRFTEQPVGFVIRTKEEDIPVQVYRHFNASCPHISENFVKLFHPFLDNGAMIKGKVGDAYCLLGDAVGMAEITLSLLKEDIQLLSDMRPVPKNWNYDGKITWSL